ncbi:MAG: hypothetical protein JWO86_131 [Myxococcaceae bacterium]|nr:hypothetical protein [Myxococcaceae bacterium]MEA2746515.1 hypothetical protein [Myxococcales bacterium]
MTAIPPAVQTVLDLFTTDLADVRFGDLDAPTLARIASDVQAASDVVVAAQLALDVARGALHERQETLLQQAQRALAYARVYAEADLALTARLDAITLPRASRRPRSDASGASGASGAESESLVLTSEAEPARRPRGRPRKLATVSAEPEPMLEGLAHSAE